jgi:Phage portal protein, lambda family
VSAKPFRILDQYGKPFQARGNSLYDAAKPDNTRPYMPRVGRDFNATAAAGQRELTSLGRYLFANVAQLQNAIVTLANVSIGNGFIPQYYGRPQGDWGNRAEELLYEWHKICVISGGAFDWRNALRVALVSIIRDGDTGVLLTTSESADYPQIQLVSSHRIGAYGEASEITEGEFAGNLLCNGAILNPWGRTVGWRVYGPDGSDFRDYSSADLAVYYRPDFSDQTRGVSQIAAGIRDWQDRKQAFEFLRLALKKEASYAVVEHTEEGRIDPDAEDITSTATDTGTLYEERVDGGSVRVFRSNSGSKIEFPESSRPSSNSQEFWERVTRDGLAAINWPYELTVNASKIGGASLRMVMEVAHRTIGEYQMIAQKMAARIDAWRIAKAIQSGELPPNPDWWKIAHSAPAELTADRGWSSQVDREEYKLGFVTLKDVAARRGKWWEEERDQAEAETDDLLMRGRRLADKHGITIEAALSLLQQRSANPPAMMTEDDSADETNTDDESTT